MTVIFTCKIPKPSKHAANQNPGQSSTSIGTPDTPCKRTIKSITFFFTWLWSQWIYGTLNPTNCSANKYPHEWGTTDQQTAIRFWSLWAAQNQKWWRTLQWHDSHQVAYYVLSNQPMNLTHFIYVQNGEMPAKLSVAMDSFSMHQASLLLFWG